MQPHCSGVGKKMDLATGMELVFKELRCKIATGVCFYPPMLVLLWGY